VVDCGSSSWVVGGLYNYDAIGVFREPTERPVVTHANVRMAAHAIQQRESATVHPASEESYVKMDVLLVRHVNSICDINYVSINFSSVRS